MKKGANMSADFICRCEGDLERISAVFIGWLKNNSVNQEKSYTIRVPNEYWASLFVDVYTDCIENHDLAEVAEQNVIQITFQVENSVLEDDEEWQKLQNMTDEELLDTLQDLLDEMDEEEDEDNDDA